MERGEFEIINRLGLHARAAAQLVQLANQFSCDVTLSKDGVEVNAKSIMGILMLAAPKGSAVELIAEGKDAAQALTAIGELINDGFGED